MADEIVTWYGVELDEAVLKSERFPFARFMAAGDHGEGAPTLITLDADNRTFKTTSRRDYERLRGLPFLNDLGEVVGEGLTARELIARMGEATSDELVSLAGDERKTVADAAKREQDRRGTETGPGVNPDAGSAGEPGNGGNG